MGRLGLSPLARGNHTDMRTTMDMAGPIPAGAGQPPVLARVLSALGAYPRWRGATWARMERDLSGRGLSPLARGNPR